MQSVANPARSWRPRPHVSPSQHFSHTQTQALPLQSSEITLSVSAMLLRAHTRLRLPLPWRFTFAQSSHPKTWLNSALLCSFPPAHLICSKWRTPDNLSLESTDDPTTGCGIYCPKLINYSTLQILWWWNLPPDLTVPVLHVVPLAPTSPFQKGLLCSSCVPSSSGRPASSSSTRDWLLVVFIIQSIN